MPTRFNLVEEASFAKSPGVAPNPGPFRRKSFLNGRSSSRNFSNASHAVLDDHGASVDHLRPRLPMEVIDLIIELYADSALSLSRIGRETNKKAFNVHLGKLSLASKAIRDIALRHFCKTLGFIDSKEANTVLDFLIKLNEHYEEKGWIGGFVWVRSLFTSHYLIPQNVEILKQLTKLTDLHMDLSSANLLSQRTCLAALFSSLSSPNLFGQVRSLTMSNIPRIDEHLLRRISVAFPALIDLHLGSVEGLDMNCCPSCYEDSLSRIAHSPIENIHPDTEALAINFADSLAPLTLLKQIHFGILLSRSTLLDWHTMHGEDSEIPMTVKSIASCFRCAKYEIETKRRELAVSLCIARRVEALEFIEWASPYAMRNSAKEADPDSVIEGQLDSTEDTEVLYALPGAGPRTSSEGANAYESLHQDGLADPTEECFRVAGFSITRTIENVTLKRVV